MLTYERKLWQAGIRYVAGVDEAGRGPLAGPVVAAAVIFPDTISLPGVDDSKKLTEKKREELLPQIKSQALAWGVGMVQPHEIDRINILQATLRAMNQAVDNLSVQPGHLLIDGCHLPDCLFSKTGIVKGDQLSLSIAAASIIAKVTRDHIMIEMDQKYPAYGFAKHKGYGIQNHIQAIRMHGYCQIHRRSFHVKDLDY